MTKKSKRQAIKTVWGVVVTFSVILGLIASILQVSGTVDFWSLLVLPIQFFTMEIPIFYAILLVITLVIVMFSAIRLRKGRKRCILDYSYGRKIALISKKPQHTAYLRSVFNIWQRKSSWLSGHGFDYYIKRLEKEGFLKYVNGEWQVTQKALEYIDKYYGR